MIKFFKGIFKLLTVFAVVLLIGTLVLSVYINKNISFEGDEMLFSLSRNINSTKIYADSDLTDEVYDPVGVENIGAKEKEYFSLSDFSDYIKLGFIAVEDREFYNHKGINLKRTLLAVKSYLFSEGRFGASTITQQVVKNISGDNEISFKRKLNEIIRAYHIERNHTKEEILELYLNIVPMSENIYGVGTASQVYFNKSPSELDYVEAASLIGIANAPSAYNPYTNPEKCKAKRNIILSVMRRDGIISDEEYEWGIESELKLVSREDRVDRVDSWFCETVLSEVTQTLSKKLDISQNNAERLLLQGGFSIYTTMDIRAQRCLEDYFYNSEIASDGENIAFCLYDSQTGFLRATIGRAGKKTQNRLLNHATTPHVPGSAIKPLSIYAPLLDEGKINAATVFDDVPCDFIENGDGSYRLYPRNSPNIYSGLVSVRDAVIKSKNTVAVRLIKMRGERSAFLSLKDDFGFTSLVDGEGGVTDIAASPMALGQLSVGVSLSELTHAYTVFPSEGVLRSGGCFIRVIDSEGRVILENENTERRIYKEDTARLMNTLLRGVVEEGTAGAARIYGVSVAGKTGTSSQSRDKLFIGYTPHYTAGIWYGRDGGDGAVSSQSAHLIAWREAMDRVLSVTLSVEERSVDFSTEGLLYLPFCKDSGRLFSENCALDARGDRLEYAYFTADNKPSGECDRHVKVKYSPEDMGVLDFSYTGEDFIYISLVKNDGRSFPCEVTVEDAEFVYRDMSGYSEISTDESKPYFYFTIPEGEFVGVSDTKRQFNRGVKKKN